MLSGTSGSFVETLDADDYPSWGGGLSFAIPDALVSDIVDDAGTLLVDESSTYKIVQSWDNGSETTYFDGTGAILGYVNRWTDPESGSTSVNYSDADWNWLGGSYTDLENGWYNSNLITNVTDGSAQLYWDESAYVAGTEIAADIDGFTADSANGTLPYIKLETGTNGNSTDGWYRSYSYYQAVSVDGEGNETWSFIGGTETESGIIRAFGPNWTFLSETLDVSDASVAVVTDLVDDSGNWTLTVTDPTDSDLTITVDIPDRFVASIGDTYSLRNGNELIFADSSGTILGYLNSWSETDADTGAVIRYGFGFNSSDLSLIHI